MEDENLCIYCDKPLEGYEESDDMCDECYDKMVDELYDYDYWYDDENFNPED